MAQQGPASPDESCHPWTSRFISRGSEENSDANPNYLD